MPTEPPRAGGAIVTAGVRYTCRICGHSHEVRVAPVIRDGAATLDLESRHRLVQAGCPECGEKRTHVAAETLAGHGEEFVAESGGRR